MIHPLTFLVLTLLLSAFALDTIADFLNARSFQERIPDEFQGFYDPAKFSQSRRYLLERIRFSQVRRAVMLGLFLAFWAAGGFGAVDSWARSWADGPIARGLVFAGALMVAQSVLQIPFSAYFTFVIEERYGFNRTTPGTFVGDWLKGLVLGSILGGVAFAGLVWFFESAGERAWLWAWLGLSIFQIAVAFVAPIVILPMFNRYSPLPPGELRDAIEKYARQESFRLEGIYTMDGSRRSSKANAFFTGFGRFRRLVLFDTLIARQSVEQILAVVAHEVGHFKRGHIWKSIALSILASAAVLYGVSLLIREPALYEAFRLAEPSTYAGLIFVGILYSPVSRFLSVLTQALSRKFEYEADEYSARTYGNPSALIESLKRMSADHLSHLTPHRLAVWLDYTHPPILERVRALRSLTTQSLPGP